LGPPVSPSSSSSRFPRRAPGSAPPRSCREASLSRGPPAPAGPTDSLPCALHFQKLPHPNPGSRETVARSVSPAPKLRRDPRRSPSFARAPCSSALPLKSVPRPLRPHHALQRSPEPSTAALRLTPPCRAPAPSWTHSSAAAPPPQVDATASPWSQERRRPLLPQPRPRPRTAREFPCARYVERRLRRQSTSPSTLRGPLVRPSPSVSILGTPGFFCTRTRALARSEPHSPAHHHCSEPPPPPHPCLRATPGPANATSE